MRVWRQLSIVCGAALVIGGCSTNVTDVTEVVEPDAAKLWATSPEASVDSTTPTDDAATGTPEDATVVNLDTGTIGAVDAMTALCSTSNIPAAWTASGACTTSGELPQTSGEYGCPACLPYYYTCGSAYPAALAQISGVVMRLSAGGGAVGLCSNVALCVTDGLSTTQCGSLDTNDTAYDCPLLADGGIPPLPAAGCSRLSPTGYYPGGVCCTP